jgi:hypothetical protein
LRTIPPVFTMHGMPSNFPNPLNTGSARFIACVFGVAFFGIGLTVLGYLWLTPFNEFGSPPLFFRIFGSFIATVFAAVGGRTAFGAIFGKANSFDLLVARANELRSQLPQSAHGSYTCPHCAAPLQSGVDVSPSGDVKCSFCNSWLNVRSHP